MLVLCIIVLGPYDTLQCAARVNDRQWPPLLSFLLFSSSYSSRGLWLSHRAAGPLGDRPLAHPNGPDMSSSFSCLQYAASVTYPSAPTLPRIYPKHTKITKWRET